MLLSSAQRAEFLAEASVLLSGSLDPEETLCRLAELVVPLIADWCYVVVLDGGTPRQLAVTHADPDKARWADELIREYPVDPTAPHGVNEVIRTGRPKLVKSISDADVALFARDERHLELLRGLGLRSAMVLPLTARGATFGAFTLVSAESGRLYGEDDVVLANELADHAALAIDNARLYSEAREAVRVRDEFLAVAAHELRTPLTPLGLHVQDLLRRSAGEGPPLSQEALIAKLAKIARQVERLESLVENLLDISRITQQRLGLDAEDADLAEIARTVASRLDRAAEQAGVALAVDAPAPVHGRWDRFRVEQVLANLISNAIKFGAGQPVEIGVTARDGVAAITVRDHGVGIAAADHARIFEKFERAAATRHYGGFGLGLWIASRIVEALGGSIGVESAPGEGTCFTVALPIAG